MDSIKNIIVDANRLILYLGKADLAEIINCVSELNITLQDVIVTKCGLHADCLEQLLNLKEQIMIYDNYYSDDNFFMSQMDPSYVYIFSVQGLNTTEPIRMDNFFYRTDIDHQFILIYYNSNWHIMDSYLNKKSFEDYVVDLDDFMTFIYESRLEWDLDRWNEIFNVDIKTKTTKCFYSVIHRCEFSTNIKETYEELISECKQLLKKNTKTRDKTNLQVLNLKMNFKSAEKYLCLLASDVDRRFE